jgi:hypothetical protein
MYKFIKGLSHKNMTYSHIAFLYQDINTKKYYLSHTNPNSENIVDNSNQFMLMSNGSKIIQPEFLKNIVIESEVTPMNFMYKQVGDYLL